jgi:hypothetical protein
MTGVYCNAGHAVNCSKVESISFANTLPVLYGTATYGDNIKSHSHKVLMNYDPLFKCLVFVSENITPIAHMYSFLHEKVRLVLLDVDGDGKIDTMLVRDDIERAMQDARSNGVAIVNVCLNSPINNNVVNATFINVSHFAKVCALVGNEKGGCVQGIADSSGNVQMLQSSSGYGYCFTADPRELSNRCAGKKARQRSRKVLKTVHWSSLIALQWVYDGDLPDVSVFDNLEYWITKLVQVCVANQMERDARRARYEKLHAEAKQKICIDETRRREAIHIQRISRNNEPDKLFTPKRSSHKARKANMSHLPFDSDKRRCKKEESIEAARQHEHDKREREAKTIMEMEKRAQILAIGDAIQNGE